jgi:hypothetical protein
MKYVGIILALSVTAAQADGFLLLGASGSDVELRASAATFQPVRIGAGGQITNINIVSDGTKVARTDTYGAWGCYRCTGSSGTWNQLVSYASLPNADTTIGQQSNAAGCCGVYEIVVAPSNTSIAYMYFNSHLYKTTDLNACAITNCPGLKWTRLSAFTSVNANPGLYTKFLGPYIAVDPVNANIVFVGTPARGLWKTTNGGASWVQVTAVGVGNTAGAGIIGKLSQGGGNIVCFDPTSAVSGGATQGIYVSTNGAGVYASTDGGATWILTTSPPTTHIHIVCDQNGTVWLTDNSANSGDNLYKFSCVSPPCGSGGTWTNIATNSGGNGYRNIAVAVDPSTSGASTRVVLGGDGGQLNISVNNGSTWTGQNFLNSRTAADIPYLAATTEGYLTDGNMAFDPSQCVTTSDCVLYFAEGIGVWWVRPNNVNASAINWTSQSAYIEQLVTGAIANPWGAHSHPIFVAQDRAFFQVTNPTAYPASMGAAPGCTSGGYTNAGWSVDWVANSDVGAGSTVVGIENQNCQLSGISIVNGLTAQIAISIASPAVITWPGSNFSAGQKVVFYNSRNVAVGSMLPTGITAGKVYYVLASGLTANSFEISATNGGSAVNTVGSQQGVQSGSTWIPFESTPVSDVGGCIAASTATNLLWVDTAGHGGPWYTVDGGATWTSLANHFNANFGIPAIGDAGWGDSGNGFEYARPCAADRVFTGNFLIYNSAPRAYEGFYLSTDGGASWSLVCHACVGGGAIGKGQLKAVPGQAGNYLWSSGFLYNVHHPTSNRFYKTANSGSSWTVCTGVTDVWTFGFGKAKTGDGSSIFIYGAVGGKMGVWESDDDCGTWTQLSNAWPNDSMDQVVDMEGDANTYGRVHIGFGGSGWVYGTRN